MKKIVMTVALGFLAATSFGAELTYDEFVKSCKNPDAFGHQRPPEQIKVICDDEKSRWVPVESAPFELETFETLSAELFSDKHHVAKETFPQPGGETTGVCPRLREEVGDVVVELSLSCSQVLNEKRDLEDICLDAIASAEAANPDIRQYVPTGETHEPCGESAPQQQQQQQQQQETQQQRF